ncbi:MAG: hypothetical protein ACPL0C_04700 [Candidatus Bathyarchaeales archaeon]
MDQRMAAFEKALVEAVDEGLLMLGESGREVVYFHLRHYYGFTKDDVPSNPQILVRCLEKIFGVGARAVERDIIKSLYRKLKLEYVEKEAFDFMEYLNEAKAQLKGR